MRDAARRRPSQHMQHAPFVCSIKLPRSQGSNPRGPRVLDVGLFRKLISSRHARRIPPPDRSRSSHEHPPLPDWLRAEGAGSGAGAVPATGDCVPLDT
eukprot:scaffold18906_cov122-Isochrysis_galbana.AAC.11